MRILFGGSNFDGEMGLELIRATPWIDQRAVIGEGDIAFPEILGRTLRGEEATAVESPGSVGRAQPQ